MKSVALYIAILAFLGVASVNAFEPLWPWEESKRLGSTVYYYSAEPLTWGGAHHACRSIKGDLVRIDSVAEHNFVKQYLQEAGVCGAWIGIRTLGAPNDVNRYRWTQGDQNVPYKNFRGGEPSTHTDERCVLMSDDIGYQWNNVKCDRSLAFVCEVAEKCDDKKKQ